MSVDSKNSDSKKVQQEKTCWDCSHRLGEECGIDGHEVYPYSKNCDAFIKLRKQDD